MNFLSIFEGIGIGWSCMVEETIVFRENHQSRIVNHYSAGNQTLTLCMLGNFASFLSSRFFLN